MIRRETIRALPSAVGAGRAPSPMPDRQDQGERMPDANDLCGVTIPCASGLSVRDYFAAVALQGLLANGPNGGAPGWKEATVAMAYQFGDAMMRAR